MADSQAQGLSIAIVGMAGRFPGAADVEQFWQNLRQGVESIRFFDEAELEASLGGRPDPADPDFVRAGGVLEDVDRFDAGFFDFNPREAEITDPQQRLFLECCWEALERAGCDPATFPGGIGVFAGAGMNTYFLNNVLAHPELFRTVAPFQLLIGADKDYLAPRVSYKLNLRGPSISVQTACSTSLVAVHLACQSLLDYQSDLALAGGVSVRVPQKGGYRYTEGGIYSPDGHCRAFDRDAGGTVTGSGAGVVVLKRLDDALADGDSVLAVIRGTAVNNDGAAKVGFTAPSVEGQVAVISEALSAAGIPAESIGYVEAHGTGTLLGDPIEVTALTRAFGLGPDRPRSCALGSVKTNIGHLDTASGVAGLIKTVLALRARALPPSLHFQAPNPEIDFDAGPFYVNTALSEWPADGTPRRAGVSSFGIGGTNAHAIVEEAPEPAPSGPSRPWQLLLLSARTPTALEAATDNLARHLEEQAEQPLADVAFTAQVGRRVFEHRRALVCESREDAAAALRARDPRRILTLAQPDRGRPVAFLLPGQGAQYPGMGRGLYEAEPAFRQALDACARGLEPHLGLDLRTVLFPGDGDAEGAAERLQQTALAQPALFAVEYALAELLREWGIRPAALLGHSVGELTAACLAGVFGLEDALALVAARGRLMQGLPAGAMLAVPRSEEEVTRLLGGGLALAAVNGPSACVISGPAAEIEALAGRLAADGLEARRLHTSHAFHSADMDPAVEGFARAVAAVRRSAPRLPFLSNVTGTWIEAAQATDPAYWGRQLRATVRFADGAAELLGDRSRVLLEVGPGRTLASLVRGAAPDRAVVTTLRHGGDEGADPLPQALARLWLAGVDVDWAGFHARERRQRVPLPTYPFERQRFWLEPAAAAERRAAAPAETAALAEPGAEPAPVSAPPAVRGHARPALATPHVPPADDDERTVAAIWEGALGIAGIGVHDDFFELGGHSLLATQITAQVRAAFGVDASLRGLFETPTVAGLAAVARRLREESAGEAAGEPVPLPAVVPDPARRHEPFPLTDVQQAYWVGRTGAFELGEVGTHIYMEIDTHEVDIARMERAWQRLVDRHDMLRAVVDPDGQQRILAEVPPYRIQVRDLRGRDGGEQALGLAEVRQAMSHQVLPSDRWPLFEVRATRLDGERTRFHISFDYLIGDAWSWQILTRDLARFYREPEADLPPLELSFRDYVQALVELERSPAFERDLAYWRERLADLPPAPELPLARTPGSLGRPRFVRHTARLPRAAWSRLKERASRAGLTSSGVLLAAYAEVLAAWSKSPRFTVNLTLFNRLPLHPQVDAVVGDFTSLTLLAVDGAAPGTFEERARRIQGQLWEDLDHRLVSGVRVMRELVRGQGIARAAMPVVFTSTLGLAAPQAAEGAGGDGDDRMPGEGGYEISQTPQVWIDHQVSELGGRLTCNWDVVEDLFPPGLVAALFGSFRGLIARLAEDEGAWGLPALDLLPRDQADLLAAVQATGRSFGPAAERLLHTLVAPADDRPAVDAPGRTLTYRELQQRALALGHRLRAAGARPNSLVGVVMEKGWEQVVAVLGIHASGAAYLPIDPDLPADRRRYLLANGEVAIVVTQPWVDERIAGEGGWPEDVLRLRVEEEAPAEEPAPLQPVQTPDDLAYVIYTSGSTGQPKGVMIDHRGAVNTVLDLNERFRVGPEDRVLALSSLSFDLSVYDIFGTLAAGGTIVFPEAGRRRDPLHWAERVASAGVTLWNSVPALMEMFAEVWRDGTPPARAAGAGTIRLVFLSGDWIPVALPARIRTLPAVAPDVELISMGGATEASIWSILHAIGEVDPAARSIPYGRPLANQSFHVLDDGLRPRPTWVPGQLYIGGVGLAKGYWRDPAKTAASFVVHPETGERLYRTGDLGRYLPDGEIEFLGREDSQVKVRGYRVELGEIEAALAGHPGLRDAVVVAREGGAPGEKRLNAYVVAAVAQEAPDAAALRAYLRERLPEYMVPAGILFLDALPLTANGKVDRRALPGVGQEAPQERREYVAPRTDIEEALAAICAEILGVEKLGVHDDFFELGGDSLMGIRAIFRIRQAVGIELEVRDFFAAPTVAGLAEVVEGMLVDQIQNLSDEEVHELL